MILFWVAVPYAIYRSKKRMTTIFIGIAAWVGSGILVTMLASFLVTTENAEGVGRVIAQLASLVAIIVCEWHSRKTRKHAIPGSRSLLL